MQGRIQKSLPPFQLLERDDLNAAHSMIDAYLSENAEQGASRKQIEISVRYEDGSRITFQEIEALFDLESKARNPEKSLEITGTNYGGIRVDVQFLNQDYSWEAGDIRVSGPFDRAKVLAESLQSLFVRDLPMRYTLATVRPIYISAVIVVLTLFALEIPNRIISLWRGGEIDVFAALIGGLSIFIVAPLFLTFLIINKLQSRKFGKFCLNWGESQVRIDRRLTIANYLSWTLPTAVALRVLL